MHYTAFKSFFTHALAEAGLLDPVTRPRETIDIDNMDRRYSIRLGLGAQQPAEPFTVTCKLNWRWDALKSARAASTEQDLLTELHDRDEAADMDTERPWLRAEVKLFASLPWGASSTLPNKATWRRFASEVTEKISPLFPVEQVEFNEGIAVLGWCGEPAAQVQCEAGGELLLSGVELDAWQPVLLPRQRDDPDREPDPVPGEELVTLAGRVSDAMKRWGEAVKMLRSTDVSLS